MIGCQSVPDAPVHIAAGSDALQQMAMLLEELHRRLRHLSEPCRVRDQNKGVGQLRLFRYANTIQIQLLDKTLHVAGLRVVSDKHVIPPSQSNLQISNRVACTRQKEHISKKETGTSHLDEPMHRVQIGTSISLLFEENDRNIGYWLSRELHLPLQYIVYVFILAYYI